MRREGLISECWREFTHNPLNMNPITSDWSIVVRNFNGSVVTCNRDLDYDGQIYGQELDLIFNEILKVNPEPLCAELDNDASIDAFDMQQLTKLLIEP
jgi:hypothetical protein